MVGGNTPEVGDTLMTVTDTRWLTWHCSTQAKAEGIVHGTGLVIAVSQIIPLEN